MSAAGAREVDEAVLEDAAAQELLEVAHHEARQAALLLRLLEESWPRKAARPEADPSEQGGELNIVPRLDIVVNVMLFLLATTAATLAVAEVEVELPAMCRGPHRREVEPGLDLSVVLTRRGITVAGHNGRLAPGCEATTSAPVPSVRARDYAALRACAERVHAAYPRETSVTLSADPEIPFDDVVAAMDALRGSEQGLLFPNVRLSAGLR